MLCVLQFTAFTVLIHITVYHSITDTLFQIESSVVKFSEICDKNLNLFLFVNEPVLISSKMANQFVIVLFNLILKAKYPEWAYLILKNIAFKTEHWFLEQLYINVWH